MINRYIETFLCKIKKGCGTQETSYHTFSWFNIIRTRSTRYTHLPYSKSSRIWDSSKKVYTDDYRYEYYSHDSIFIDFDIGVVGLIRAEIVEKIHDNIYKWEGGEQKNESNNRIDGSIFCWFYLLIISSRCRISDSWEHDCAYSKKCAKLQNSLCYSFDKIKRSCFSSWYWYYNRIGCTSCTTIDKSLGR